MPSYVTTAVPPPQSWEEFEDITRSAANAYWSETSFVRHGRLGQKQDGVDVHGHDKIGQLIGFQCKKTSHTVSEQLILTEVANAEKFSSPIAILYIATTAPANAKLQSFVLDLSAQRQKTGGFDVRIWFWREIWDALCRDRNALFHHYEYLRPWVSAYSPPIPHDQQLFAQFSASLPYEPTIRRLNEQDFERPFSLSLVEPLYQFVGEGGDPGKMFFDNELQQKCDQLRQTGINLERALCQFSGPVADGQYAVPLDQNLSGVPLNEEQVEQVRTLELLAAAFTEEYKNFVRLGIRKFAPGGDAIPS